MSLNERSSFSPRDGAQQAASHRARQSGHSSASSRGQAVQRAGHNERQHNRQDKKKARYVSKHKHLEHQAAEHGPVRSCHSHAHSRLPYGKDWWVPPPQPPQQQQMQQQFMAPAPRPNVHQASGMLQHRAVQPGHGEVSRQKQDQRSPQRRNATLPLRLPLGQPPLPAAPVVQAHHRSATAPLHLAGQQLEPHAHRMPAPGRNVMDLRQTRGSMQPVQSSPVHASVPPAVRQQPAPAVHHALGMPAPALPHLHNEVEMFAQRATSTMVSIPWTLPCNMAWMILREKKKCLPSQPAKFCLL